MMEMIYVKNKKNQIQWNKSVVQFVQYKRNRKKANKRVPGIVKIIECPSGSFL